MGIKQILFTYLSSVPIVDNNEGKLKRASNGNSFPADGWRVIIICNDINVSDIEHFSKKWVWRDDIWIQNTQQDCEI